MGYPTSNPTIYSAKPDPGQPKGGDEYQHPDANQIRALLIALSARTSNYAPTTQSIGISSNGTSYFAPSTAQTPKNCFIVAKNATAGALLAAGYHCSKLSSNRIQFTHDSGAKKGSAYATVFY
jgi:hypothetical protein